ncbi:MAG TPA: hypothetical protein DEH78_28150 [Solibacterales bacterium]|nr:hypothetical protein [Bryobacterales bacterium]
MVTQERAPRLAAAAIACWFLVSTWQSLLGGFNQDDLMNMYRGFLRPWGELIFDHAAIWKFSPTYRPFGALFYKAVHEVLDLSPLPFRVVCLSVIAVNLALVYRFSAIVSGARFTGALAALLLTFHGSLFWLYYGTGLCYDIFCFTWYFAAFTLYVRARNEQRFLRAWEMALWIVCYLLCLNSKEMAVSLPVTILAYEWLFHPPRSWRPGALLIWLLREGRIALAGALLTAIYIVGRVLSPEVVSNAAYAPVLTPQRYLESGRHYWGEFLYHHAGTLPGWIAVAATLTVLFAALRGGRAARLGAVILFAGSLPLIFIPPRGLDGMYIPLAGLALLTATTVADMKDRLRVPPAVAFVALFALLLALHGRRTVKHEPHGAEGDALWSVYQQMKANFPKVAPNTRILWVRDPFPEFGWGSHFLTRLAYSERNIEVARLDNVTPAPTPGRLAEFDLYWWYEDGRLTAIPAPRFRKECLSAPTTCPGE